MRGFDAATVAKLRPYVTALPGRTAINVNTATDVVLMAVMPGMSRREDRRAGDRDAPTKPFASDAAIADWANALDPTAGPRASTSSRAYFDVRVGVAQDDVQLATDALVQRATGPGAAAPTVMIWRRTLY